MRDTRRALHAAVALGAVGFALVIAASLAPVWPLELFEHFRVQYAVVGLAVVAACGALQIRGSFDAAAIAWLVNACVLSTGMLDRRVEVTEGHPVRVMLLNVHTRGSSFDQVAALIRDVQPDVIGLVEVDQRWLQGLAPALEGFSRIEEPRRDNIGIALYARGVVTGGVENLGSELPSVVAGVEVGGARLSVVVTHPMPPVRAPLSDELARQLDAVARRSTQLAAPVIVMGDLNTTPWSRTFARLRAQTGLCDTRDGFGVHATFPASSWIVRIPIDHVLVSCSIGVRDRRVERDVGSDHLPVVVDLVVPRGS